MLAISGCNNKQTNQPIENSTQVETNSKEVFHVIHTGKMNLYYDRDGNVSTSEIIDIYDTNGNRFVKNYSSEFAALSVVAELKKEGKDAIIGPVAPQIDPLTGDLAEKQRKDGYGVYIVEQKEFEKGIEPGE